MRITYRISCFLVRIYMKVLFGYQLVGKENLDEWKPCIIAANHLSYNDPPFIGAVLKHEVHFLAKKELFNNKLLGALLRFFNSLPIKRGVFDKEMLRGFTEKIKEGHSILLFPEGSRKSFTAKPGIGLIVYETGAPVLPIKIENSNRIIDCLLKKKRVRIIIGKLIDTKPYLDKESCNATYREIAENILDTINALN